eukprot:TRINITY_DN3199_c1_g1_i1.p1 TRINITY_DN3199_c1_g1~~TRINITY_DN3199_c1_g1_i1.p1  ORF type:complete len:376 (+),score=139.37 TRINITY_DN3199_c1_g1_i1:742-1869(+)
MNKESNFKAIFLVTIPIIISAISLQISQTTSTTINLCFLSFLSISGFFATLKFIPIVKQYCLNAELYGKDINKNGTEKIPESLGIVPGVVYLTCVVLFQPFFTSMLGEYNAAMTSVCFMLLLGFADDVLNLRWAVKIGFSFLATLPLLVAYSGATTILFPKPLRFIYTQPLDLGLFYHIYMACIAVFCTNSINIYAGINGLESGQSLIIGCSVLIHNLIEYYSSGALNQLLSIFLILPFVATILPLCYFNAYPSQVFVGDTFTYFAGMTLAVAGILGHFSKTLIALFIPQLINFIFSLPQLLRIVPCPRHRLPKFNPKTGLLEAEKKHFTLINFALYIFGPTNEGVLCRRLLIFQIICCASALFVRHSQPNYFYD